MKAMRNAINSRKHTSVIKKIKKNDMEQNESQTALTGERR